MIAVQVSSRQRLALGLILVPNFPKMESSADPAQRNEVPCTVLYYTVQGGGDSFDTVQAPSWASLGVYVKSSSP